MRRDDAIKRTHMSLRNLRIRQRRQYLPIGQPESQVAHSRTPQLLAPSWGASGTASLDLSAERQTLAVRSVAALRTRVGTAQRARDREAGVRQRLVEAGRQTIGMCRADAPNVLAREVRVPCALVVGPVVHRATADDAVVVAELGVHRVRIGVVPRWGRDRAFA